jgi:hypothetical protein
MGLSKRFSGSQQLATRFLHPFGDTYLGGVKQRNLVTLSMRRPSGLQLGRSMRALPYSEPAVTYNIPCVNNLRELGCHYLRSHSGLNTVY